MRRDSSQGGTIVLSDIAVGADILKQGIHGGAGQVDAVAALHIAALGVTGRGVLEHLGTVEELPAVVLAHLDDGLVVFVHLGLGQALVGMLLAQGRDGVDDDVHAGIGFLHGLDALLIAFDKVLGAVGGAQVVGAEGDNDPLGLHDGHGFGHGLVTGKPFELHTFVGSQGTGRHTHRADGIVIAAVIKHAVHARRVGIPQEEGIVDVFLPGVLGFFQNGGGILGGVDGVLVLVVPFLIHHFLGGLAFRVGIGAAQAVNDQKSRQRGNQDDGTADGQHKIHAAFAGEPGPKALFGCFVSFARHNVSFLSGLAKRVCGISFSHEPLYFTPFFGKMPVVCVFLHKLHKKGTSLRTWPNKKPPPPLFGAEAAQGLRNGVTARSPAGAAGPGYRSSALR